MGTVDFDAFDADNHYYEATDSFTRHLPAQSLATLGLYKADRAALVKARAAATTAMQLSPAFDCHALIVTVLIDEAGLDGDAKAWVAARRLRTASSALDKLVTDHDPLAAKIRAAKQWTEVPGAAKADTTRAGISDLRLARLLGDPALEARARAVFDDKLVRLRLEISILRDPGDDIVKEDLAYLDRH